MPKEDREREVPNPTCYCKMKNALARATNSDRGNTKTSSAFIDSHDYAMSSCSAALKLYIAYSV